MAKQKYQVTRIRTIRTVVNVIAESPKSAILTARGELVHGRYDLMSEGAPDKFEVKSEAEIAAEERQERLERIFAH